MAQKVFGLTADIGDGSSIIYYFKSIEDVEFVLDENNGYESFWNSEISSELTFPDDLDLEACGFSFFSRED